MTSLNNVGDLATKTVRKLKVTVVNTYSHTKTFLPMNLIHSFKIAYFRISTTTLAYSVVLN